MKSSPASYLLALLLAALVMLPATLAASGTTTAQSISQIILTSGGTVQVFGTSDWKNPDKCASSAYAILRPGHKFYREQYATLLNAHAQQLDVKLQVKGCARFGGKTRPVIIGTISKF